MQHIVPAVIPASLAHLRETLARLRFSKEIQIDIVDGIFVPFTSWPYEERGDIGDLAPLAAAQIIEVDLMIEKPEDTARAYLEAGARRLVVHLESTKRLSEIAGLKSEFAFELGLSIQNDTPLETLLDSLEHADYVQFMGIAQIGAQGLPFDARVLERIRTFKELHPDMPVSIDGSVTLETLPALRDAGAKRFVSGSAIVKAADPESAYKALSALL